MVQLHPNKLVGVLGEHADFPVERMQLSRDRVYVGSCSHDKSVRFWNVSGITVGGGGGSGGGEGDDSEFEDADDSDADVDMGEVVPGLKRQGDGFFDDL